MTSTTTTNKRSDFWRPEPQSTVKLFFKYFMPLLVVVILLPAVLQLGGFVSIGLFAWVLLVFLVAFGSWRYAAMRVAQHQLQLEAELHARVFAWTTEGVMITDQHGNILDVNDGFSRITGYSHDEVIGRNPRILSSGRHDKDFYRRMWSDIQSSGFWEGEIYNRSKDGALYCEWLRIAAAFDHNNQLINYIAVFSDVTKRKATQQALLRQSHEDPLTGLANRAALEDFLTLELARARRSGKRIACLYFDLNEFQPINDTYGHHVGDTVLREIAHRLTAHARDTDCVARLTGDEFIVVLSDVFDFEQVDQIAERILKSLEQDINTSAGSFVISISHGMAFYPEDGKDREALIHQAKEAMYRDKHESKNT